MCLWVAYLWILTFVFDPELQLLIKTVNAVLDYGPKWSINLILETVK